MLGSFSLPFSSWSLPFPRLTSFPWCWAFPSDSVVKNFPANAGDAGDTGSTPRSGRSPGFETTVHYSILGWKIPWAEEAGLLQSMGLQRVGHDWTHICTHSLVLLKEWCKKLGQIHPRKWKPTPVFLPGESQGQKSLVGCSPWDQKELGTVEWLTLTFPYIVHGQGFPGGTSGKESASNAGDTGSIPGSGRSFGEGNGSPLQAAVHGATKSWT